jgi:hypothetical protein
LATLCASVSCYGVDNVFEKSINTFTRDIYYRYYLIQRCQEPVELLQKNPAIWKQINFDNLDLMILDNEIVQEKAALIQIKHVIHPFLELWHQINTHRHLDDASFHKDFVKLLFMLYKSLEQPTHQKATAAYSIEKMLSTIDKYTDKVRPNNPKKNAADYYGLPDPHAVTTDDIALNYYLIQRLDKPIKLLSAMRDELVISKAGWVDHAMCNMAINFSHERMNYCFNQMTMRKNLEPFLHAWQEFSRFRHAGDAHFLKEMLMMLFAVYKDLLFVRISEESEEFITSEMNTILDLYEHVNELPLDEILHAIDITTDKLLLLQSMDKKAKQSWSQQYPLLFNTLLALPIAYIIVKTWTL